MTNIPIVKPTYKIFKPNYYEAKIVKADVVDNQYHRADKPESGPPKQLMFQFSFIDPETKEAAKIGAFVSPIVTKKSKFSKVCKAVFPNTYDPEDELSIPDLENFTGKPVRIQVKTITTKEGHDKSIVDDFCESEAEGEAPQAPPPEDTGAGEQMPPVESPEVS